MRSSTIVRRNVPDVEGGQHHRRAVQPDLHEQLAVAAGDVEQRHRDEVARWPGRSSRSMSITRIAVSTLDRKFSWVVIAPLGKPVVPLV